MAQSDTAESPTPAPKVCVYPVKLSDEKAQRIRALAAKTDHTMHWWLMRAIDAALKRAAATRAPRRAAKPAARAVAKPTNGGRMVAA